MGGGGGAGGKGKGFRVLCLWQDKGRGSANYPTLLRFLLCPRGMLHAIFIQTVITYFL